MESGGGGGGGSGGRLCVCVCVCVGGGGVASDKRSGGMKNKENKRSAQLHAAHARPTAKATLRRHD